MWTALDRHLTQTVSEWLSLSASEADDHRRLKSVELTRIVELFSMWVAFRHGSRIADSGLVMRAVQSVTRSEVLRVQQSAEAQTAIVGLVGAFSAVKASQPHAHQLQTVLSGLFSPASTMPLPASVVLHLISALASVPSMQALVLRWAFAWVDAVVVTDVARNHRERREWLTILLAVTKSVHQHDAFYYAQQARDRQDEQLPELPAPTAKLTVGMPSATVKALLQIVADALSSASSHEEKESEGLYGALQLLSLSGSADVSQLLSSAHSEDVRSSLDGRGGGEQDEEDDQLTVHHVLLALSHRMEKAMQALPHPSAHPPLPLFSRTPACPTTSPAIRPTTAAVDRLLYLTARALISSHLLSSSISPFAPASFLRAQHRHVLRLLHSYGAHPAALRSLLSLLSTAPRSPHAEPLHDDFFSQSQTARHDRTPYSRSCSPLCHRPLSLYSRPRAVPATVV